MKCYIEHQIKRINFDRDCLAFYTSIGLEEIFSKLKGDNNNIAISDPVLCRLADDIVYIRNIIGRRK